MYTTYTIRRKAYPMKPNEINGLQRMKHPVTRRNGGGTGVARGIELDQKVTQIFSVIINPMSHTEHLKLIQYASLRNKRPNQPYA